MSPLETERAETAGQRIIDELVDAAANHWLEHHMAQIDDQYIVEITDALVIKHKKRELFRDGAYLALHLSACRNFSNGERAHFALYSALANGSLRRLKEDARGRWGWKSKTSVKALASAQQRNVELLKFLSAKTTNSEKVQRLTVLAIDSSTLQVRKAACEGWAALVEPDDGSMQAFLGRIAGFLTSVNKQAKLPAAPVKTR